MKTNVQLINEINSTQIRNDLPKIEVGDNIEISTKWFDRSNSEKFKVNVFKGTVISLKKKKFTKWKLYNYKRITKNNN